MLVEANSRRSIFRAATGPIIRLPLLVRDRSNPNGLIEFQEKDSVGKSDYLAFSQALIVVNWKASRMGPDAFDCFLDLQFQVDTKSALLGFIPVNGADQLSRRFTV